LSPARQLAFEILRLTAGGAHADDLVHERGQDLSDRDRALACEIVFGALRHQAQLDYLIEAISGRTATKLDSEVRLILRMAIYQMRYLERLPAHAVVSESVELVKRARKRSATGFVNAVLRKVDRRPVRFPDRATDLSMPAWMLERWERHYGVETATGIARAFLERPETYMRGDRVQDIGSQSIVPLLGLEPGMRFLDLCAAPGNKTAQALETGIRAVACDRSVKRLAALAGLRCDRVVLDGTQPLPFQRVFDRILVDAPCTGTGTIGRNPEIRWRIQPSDIDRQAERQRKLLRNALDCLGPGGRLVYSTCSLEPEENQGVIDAVIGENHQWRVIQTMLRIPGREPGDGFFAAVLTST